MKVAAIILAAGYSSRMGAFKPLLPLGKGTVLETIVTVFQEAGVPEIMVVAGYRSEEVLSRLAGTPARCLLNEDFDAGMFSSVKSGLRGLDPGVQAFFVHPVDIPLIRPWTLRRLLEIHQETGRRIVYPCYRGTRGHPPLIASSLAGRIALWQGPGGLGGALAQWESQACEVEVADRHILFDLDTPGDYRSLRVGCENRDIPDGEECEVLLRDVFALGEGLCSHSRSVARLALALGTALKEAGCDLDLDLIRAGALLHDIAKGQPDHAREGARILEKMGFSRVAAVVAAHVDIPPAGEGMDERQVVYLADKLTAGSLYVGDLAQRFRAKMARFSHAPEIQRNIQERLDRALEIRARIEARIGRTLDLPSLEGFVDRAGAPP